ncbi:MAG: HAMP domain-containing histidine kinase [Bacilli bacterium]|nr:HAMP domain-containing histidine kinase [Bacilli bacterium]
MSIIVIVILLFILLLVYKNFYSKIEKEKDLKIALFKLTHEIKNPLTVCKGYLNMMDYNDKENIRNYLDIIRGEIDRTVMIINEFSDYGKLTLDKDVVEISLLLEEIYETIKPLVKSTNIKTKFNNIDDEIYLDIDYLKMKQVLINILKNSIEAKKKDEDMLLEVDVGVNNNYLNINIKDTGIGMTKETLSRISEIFFTTKQNGTGLGVGLSKEIIKLHNGSINYKSKYGKGTSVLIKLPVK